MSNTIIVREAMDQNNVVLAHSLDLNFEFQDQVQAMASETWVTFDSDVNVQGECKEVLHAVENLSDARGVTNSSAIETTNVSEDLKRVAYESSARSRNRASRKKFILL